MLKYLGLNEVELRDNYDAVFHLVTTAIGAKEYYTLENNKVRKETPEEAIALDNKITEVWKPHPHFDIVDNSTNFEQKLTRLLNKILTFLKDK